LAAAPGLAELAAAAPVAMLLDSTTVPPAPMVRLPPGGKAPALATASVPALTVVPPV
jgi:hypothetical protein